MPKWAKIVLVILGVFLVIVIGVVIAGVVWWNKSGKQFFEGAMQAVVEGQNYGRSTDNKACVDESLSRYKSDKSISGTITAKSFLTGCLQTSRVTPGFCDGVPGRLDFTDSARWREAECRANGLGDDPNCVQLFDSVQQHCEKNR